MKRTVILTIFLLLGLLPAAAREYAVPGPEGGLAMKVALPDGFNPATDRCPMVLLMHGIFSSKDYNPMPSLAKALARAGIVPMWCSEQYLATYGDRATLVKIDGENHLITRRKKEILARTVDFFREVLD